MVPIPSCLRNTEGELEMNGRLQGIAGYELVQLAFHFIGFGTYDALVNPDRTAWLDLSVPVSNEQAMRIPPKISILDHARSKG